jgi:DNA-binding Lrp family transcriptional regulator
MPTTKQDVHKSVLGKVLSPREAEVARMIQGDIPLAPRPFQQIAQTVGLTEEEALVIAAGFRERAIIRKFAAIVRHQKVGYNHNVMVIWAVPPERTEAAGNTFASFEEVTHCYERTPPFAGRYNIFTMIHFKQETDEVLLNRMAEATGIEDFRVLRSVEEFKKNSMEYF